MLPLLGSLRGNEKFNLCPVNFTKFYGFEKEMTNREYLEDEDAEEPDDFVISLTSQVSHITLMMAWISFTTIKYSHHSLLLRVPSGQMTKSSQFCCGALYFCSKFSYSSSFFQQITRRDEGMAPFISGEKRNYVFGGICGIAASASIKVHFIFLSFESVFIYLNL